jgi:hypothetical protein
MPRTRGRVARDGSRLQEGHRQPHCVAVTRWIDAGGFASLRADPGGARKVLAEAREDLMADMARIFRLMGRMSRAASDPTWR